MAEDLRGQRSQERSYAVLSSETIKMFAEAAGFGDLPDDLIQVLTEDASYRLREIIQAG